MSKSERKINTDKRTIKSIKLQGMHAILKPTQFAMIKINFDTMEVLSRMPEWIRPTCQSKSTPPQR